MADWTDGITLNPAQVASIPPNNGGDWTSGINLLPGTAPAAVPAGVSAFATPAPTGVQATMDDVEGGGMPSAGIGDIGDRSRNVLNKAANGIMLGMAPRAGAAFDAATGRAPTYADALAGRNQDQTTAADSLGPLSTPTEMAGSAVLPFGLLGNAMKGASFGGKVYGGMVAGSGMGAIGGAASSPDLTDMGATLPSMANGAMMGGALGAGMPLAGGAVGGIVNKVAPFVGPSPVDGMSRSAFGLLSAANGPRVQGALDQLGPDGMLLDAAPQMKGLAQGVAIKPGDAQDSLVDALVARNAGTNQRLATSVDSNLGPAISPAQIGQQMGAKMDATGPMYAQALAGAGPIDITPVQQALANAQIPAKGAEAARLGSFEGLLRGPGTDAAGNVLPENWAPALQRAKFDMDRQIAAAQAQDGSAAANTTRQMVGVRGALNDAMTSQIPGFADANLAYGTAARGLENFDIGRNALRGGANPSWSDDFASDFGNLPLEQQALQRAGARSDIEEAMRTNPNDLLALRRKVGGEGDFNQDKMGTLFGTGAAQNVVGDIDRNTTFRNNYNEITQGSNTANKLAGSAMIDGASDGASLFPKNVTFGGLLANAGEATIKKLYGMAANASNEKVRMDLAGALSATGAGRAPIENPLLDALRRSGQAGQAVVQGAANPGSIAAALAALGPPGAGPQSSRR